MKTTWVLLMIVGIVSADIGLGYHYKVPQTSYGTPSYDYNNKNTQYNNFFGLESDGYKGSVGYQNGGSQSSVGNTNYQSTNTNLLPNYSNYPNGNTLSTIGFQNQFSSSSQYQSSAQQNYQHNYQIHQQAPIVYKHFYVHAAPEEPEPVKVDTPIVLPPAQKHYKIIFVKVPSEGHRSQAVIPVQQQNEEKTIVYVLVKKPEDHQELIVPKVEQKPPSKPEVFFIKYKNKEDSQAVIDNIVKDYNKGQNIVTTNLGENGFNSVSGAGDTTFFSPVVPEVSGNVQGGYQDVNQPGTFNSASVVSGSVNYNEGNVASSTGSTVDNESAGAISTSQGVPYETYGPPKFRVD